MLQGGQATKSCFTVIEGNRLARVMSRNLLEALLLKLWARHRQSPQAEKRQAVWPLRRTGSGGCIVFVRRQVDGAGRKIDHEGDHSGNEEQDQAQAVQGRDLPVDAAGMRLAQA